MQWFNDVLMMSMNLSNIAISNIIVFDYRWIISRISKRKPLNLLQKDDCYYCMMITKLRH